MLVLKSEKCREFLEKRGYAMILLTDLSKAFDCINHDLLIAKLHAYGFSLESLTFIQSYLPQGSIPGLLFFNIFICGLFIDDIDIDLANYADHTTPYAYDLELDKVIKSLKKILISFLTSFQITFLKLTLISATCLQILMKILH